MFISLYMLINDTSMGYPEIFQNGHSHNPNNSFEIVNDDN